MCDVCTGAVANLQVAGAVHWLQGKGLFLDIKTEHIFLWVKITLVRIIKETSNKRTS